MPSVNIRVKVNGTWRDIAVDPWERLVDVLRNRLGLTGTKEGCGEGECGACTVTMNGRAVLSCLVPAARADGGDIVTIEGLQHGGELHPIQKAFVDESALQCGFCTPGMIMAAHALIAGNPDPSEEQVRTGLANNLCRCTGYDRPVKAVLRAAQGIKEAHHD
jgi:carbon-monoxide dehydrogenase small subunit